MALEKYFGRCMCCGASAGAGVYLCVDHIKPRKTHPELALELSNLQILCNKCNHGKGNWSTTDWRDNETFIVTEHWIKENATTPGGCGYTDAQMRALGVKKTKGWIKKAAGTHITQKQRKEFEDGKRQRSEKYAARLKQQEIDQAASKIKKEKLAIKRSKKKLRRKSKQDKQTS